MGMSVGNSKGVVSEMNVVPLIDILLVLLIIFMVISPLTPQGLDAQIPQPAPPESVAARAPEPDVVVVQVTADGSLRINQTAVEWNDLGPRLQEIFKRRAQRVAFIHGDGALEFRHVARAIDIMKGAGIDAVGLLTKL